MRPDPEPGPDPTLYQLLKKGLPAALGVGAAGLVTALLTQRPLIYALMWIVSWLVVFGVATLLHRRR